MAEQHPSLSDRSIIERLWSSLRSFLYDGLIVSFTSIWYSTVLSRLQSHSRILDVGIGTGAALIRNASLLHKKDLRVTGVDIDAHYVISCRNAVKEADLGDHVQVVHASVYDFGPDAVGKDESNDTVSCNKFDYVYFSGSFMLLPDPIKAVHHVVDLLHDKNQGKILFTQTFELQKNPLLEWVKPRLSYWTTIDFGQVTYQNEFERILERAGLVVESISVIPDGKNAPNKRFSALVVATPGPKMKESR